MPSERWQLGARLAKGADLELARAFSPRGAVVELGDGVAKVMGLPSVGSEELVQFDSGALGFAYDLASDHTGVVLLTEAESVRAGEGARALGRLPFLPVSGSLFGRIIDPLGRPLDDRPPCAGEARPLFREAPELVERATVERPLFTGVMVLDCAIPIGRGQRQLIVGDRNVGKTALALDIVAAQKAGDVACVYVVIGQPLARVLAVRQALEENGALSNTIVVAANSAASPGLKYLAPYAGAAVAEYFRERGEDVLVVFDDLTKHADAYRELALLVGRPPGREAFPGDIFYVHAQLLERATAFSSNVGGGSITALPIVETTDSDISAYIPTNLVSITDGQIYLSTALFERNQRPAVDIGRSVSRIGGAAQPPALRVVARNLRIAMSRFDALAALTRVGLDVDPQTRLTVTRGHILRELLRQPRFCFRAPSDQILALETVSRGGVDSLTPTEACDLVWSAARRLRSDFPEDVAALEESRMSPADWEKRLHSLVSLPETGE